jgi:hypothetical protein
MFKVVSITLTVVVILAAVDELVCWLDTRKRYTGLGRVTERELLKQRPLRVSDGWLNQ